MSCPFHQNKLRDGLPPLIDRIAKLPIDERGYPVPFFVSWIDGKPEFRIADGKKFRLCLQRGLCWVCGQPLGRRFSFLIGPMCTVNRTTAEPPEHVECGEWSAKACPFLTKPQMERREDDFTKQFEEGAGGIMIKRNTGVSALWVTETFKLFPDDRGGILFNIGKPKSVTWWREGRPATRDEVLRSMAEGLPILEGVCQSDEERQELHKCRIAALEYVPKE